MKYIELEKWSNLWLFDSDNFLKITKHFWAEW